MAWTVLWERPCSTETREKRPSSALARRAKTASAAVAKAVNELGRIPPSTPARPPRKGIRRDSIDDPGAHSRPRALSVSASQPMSTPAPTTARVSAPVRGFVNSNYVRSGNAEEQPEAEQVEGGGAEHHVADGGW